MINHHHHRHPERSEAKSRDLLFSREFKNRSLHYASLKRGYDPRESG
jgi:hypothetical protein